MARGKDLAGLAALGALGMMMSKGKTTEVEDRFGPGAGTPYGKKIENKPSNVDIPKEVPFEGMPVSENDALPSYLAKQAIKPSGKPKITDVFTEDNSPAYKKNELGEVYAVVPEGRLKAYKDRQNLINANVNNPGYSAGMKKGGVVKMARGGLTSSASKRADGIAQKGKTRGKIC